MRTKVAVSIAAVIVVIGGVVLFMMMHSGQSSNTNTSTTASATHPNTSTQSASNAAPATPATTSSGTSTASGSATTPSAGTTKSLTITANDTSASPETINVKKGDTVKLTFKVSSAGTYHGGLEFKSTDPAVDSGSIAEGSSGTVSFTATKSFKFTPYWYQSNVQKDYFVNVDVQ